MKQARPFLISGIITAAIMIGLSFFIEDDYSARGTAAAGVIAGSVIASIPIYNIDKWSLLRRSVVHFLIMLVFVLPALLYAQWYSVPVSLLVFLGFGVAGWTIGFTVNRVQK